MNQKLQGMIAGVLIGIMLTGGTVFAQSISETVEIAYNNIKIFIDGAEYVAKDGNGNVVEPFVYNGTTYLPVRGIANAFGKDVVWDGKTSSIYLGKKGQNQPENYLDRIQYSYYNEGEKDNNLYKINGKITDCLKNDYTSGMLFNTSWNGWTIEDDKDKAEILIDYPLNGQYKELTGKIVLPQQVAIAGFEGKDVNSESVTSDILFYADDRLIHTATQVTKTMPYALDLDIKGVNKLTIKIKSGHKFTYTALTDLALYK